MKQILLLLAFLSINVLTYSQISIAPADELYDLGKDDFKPAQLAQFRRTVTHFVYRKEHASQLEAFEKILKENWTVTKYKLIPFSDLNKYTSNQGNSFFSITGFSKVPIDPTSITTIASTNIFYCLWMPVAGKKDKLKPLYLARFILHHSMSEYASKPRPTNKDALNYYHNEATLLNADLGHLQTYIKFLNSEMLKPLPKRGLFEEGVNLKEAKSLKTKQLLVPEYCFDTYSPFTGQQTEDKKDLMNDYRFKYKVVSNETLNKTILESTEPIYYLVYIRSNTDKYLSIFNSKTGAIIYNEYVPISYNLKPKDIKEIYESLTKH